MTRAQFIVGIGIIVWKDGKILGGRRKSAFGAGEWSIPGGSLEEGETIEEAIARELYEETGITARFIRVADVVPWTNRPGGINIVTITEWENGEPENREPDKCEGWEWRSLDDLPDNLFSEFALFLQRGKSSRP